MSQIQSELYDIFKDAFQLLKTPGTPQSRANVLAEVIKFLELLKNQSVDQKLARHDFTRDFFAWLALQILAVALDPELGPSSSLIIDKFLDILSAHASSDPLVLTRLLSIFEESINGSLSRVNRSNDVFVVESFNVGSTRPPNVEGCIVVDDVDGISPVYAFYLMIVDRSFDSMVELDPSVIFGVVDVLVKMADSCGESVKSRTLFFALRLIAAVCPSGIWEWRHVYSTFDAIHTELLRGNRLTPEHWDQMKLTLTHIIDNTSGFFDTLSELMFVLSVEIANFRYPGQNVHEWVDITLKILKFTDLRKVDYDSFMPKLIHIDKIEFLPLIEAFLIKNVDIPEDSSVQSGVKKTFVLEQKSSTWKSCLNVIAKVPTIAYSSKSFDKMLTYSAKLITIGRRLTYLLNVKYPTWQFQLLSPRCLRSLSAVPFTCNECLDHFDSLKYAALVAYAETMLSLFADLEQSQLDDTYVVDHLTVLFTLPWVRPVVVDHSTQIDCLNGVANLVFVMPPAKSRKIVQILTSIVSDKISNEFSDGVKKKYLSILILLLFVIADDVIPNVMAIVKHYLTDNNVTIFNKFIRYRFFCFVSNRCVVRRGVDNWELLCIDCDSLPNTDVSIDFGLSATVTFLSKNFVQSSSNQTGDNLCRSYAAAFGHSTYLQSPEIVFDVVSAILKHQLQDDELLGRTIQRLCFCGDGSINKNVVLAMLRSVCYYLTGAVFFENKTDFHAAVKMMKQLLEIPYPSELSIFKILTTYFLPNGVDVCGVQSLFKNCLLRRGRDIDKFYKTYEHHISSYIVNFLRTNNDVKSSFFGIMHILGHKPDENMIGTNVLSSIIADVVKLCDIDTSIHLIYKLSSLFNLDVKSFIDKHYEQVFTEIYCLEDSTIISERFVPILERVGIDLETSIHQNYSQLVCKLILSCRHPLKIVRFLFHSKERTTENVESLMNVLKQHFIGCLTVMESLMPTSSVDTVKKHIRCMSTFIKILGSKIVTEIQAKLLSTMRSFLPPYYHLLPKKCVQAWALFCYSVDVKKIGPYVSTILINVLPLLEKFPDVVSDIFHYFVVDNGEHFRDQLPLLYFIPCYPTEKMQRVWCVVQSSVLVKNRNIFSTIDNIYCDSAETKIVALERLRTCLKEGDLLESLKSGNESDSLFELILTCLLDNINHKNNEVKTLCGACLGELSAIDPMKFGCNDAHKTYSPFKYNLSADDFSTQCITKIVHCLGKYDDSRTTVVLYSTIQELLRLHLVDKTETEKYAYFNRFNVQDRYVLQPLLQTKYIFKGVKTDRVNSNLAFGYHTTLTPCEWATGWASQMLAKFPASYEKTVLTTCLPAMRIDSEVMETVLPYLLLYSLLYNDDVEFIEKEMKNILHWDLSKHRTKPDGVMMIVGETNRSVIHSDVSQTKFVAIILDLLDFVNQAASDRCFFDATIGTGEDELEVKVKNFVSKFDSCAMSWKSFVQNDHCRSLFYFEKSSSDVQTTNLKPLRNIYTKLNDVDGLIGVAKSSMTAPSTEETLVDHIVYGSIQDALSGYERLSSKYCSTDTYRGLIQCYVNINQPLTALAVSSRIIDSEIYLKPDLFTEHVDALWDSAEYERTSTIFNELNDEFLCGHSWTVDLVGIFRLMRQPSDVDVIKKIQSIRLDIVNSLCDLNRNGMNLYRAGYWYVVKLHILNDVEYLSELLYSLPPQVQKCELESIWAHFKRRLSVLPSRGNFALDVRKTHLRALDLIYDVTKFKLDTAVKEDFSSLLGDLWLDLAREARKKGCLQDSYTCIGIAQKYEPPKLFIELAKYYQAKFDTDSAVLVLQQGLNRNNTADNRLIAKAKLLTASFNVSSMNLDFNDGYLAFKDAAEMCNMEKSFVCLASYLYRQHLSETDPDNTKAKRCTQLESARNFSKSLLYGTKHIYQSMPCALSLWLDYGARVAKNGPKRNDENVMKILEDFDNLMRNNLSCLPTYMFMTAFSQILSRINHRQPSCFDIIKLIICQIIQDFPQQAMWSFIAVCRSSNVMQKKRTEEILRRIKSTNKDLSRFLKIFNDLTEKLIEIALKKLKYSKTINLNQISPQLKVLISAHRHVPVMLPLQKFLTVHLSTCKNGDPKQHVPYPLAPVYITDVRDQVLMLFSVQMPKRLEFVGSDGESYPLMCKKDDLRLDSRIMEFNSVINSLLRRDPVAKEKELSIRTYSVVPLNSECGIIEWLSGLLSLKGIVIDMYSRLGVLPMPMSQIKKLMLVQKDEVDMAERLRRFVEVILPKHPPVLHKWFFERHPSADAWYHCRNAFVKSSAVMSIVGYIVGLGDRHGENILIDTTTGEAVHVDFNCLFNRSDLLFYPETVPFRLTHSMVRAFGATGVEGLFVISCQVANRVMRRNSDQLISVMKPFLYDIDVKPSNSRKVVKDNADDQHNDEAKVNIQNIEMRLNGVVRCKTDQFAPHRNSKPLSVEGQTRMLIREATSQHNLCQMFAGWAPYM